MAYGLDPDDHDELGLWSQATCNVAVAHAQSTKRLGSSLFLGAAGKSPKHKSTISMGQMISIYIRDFISDHLDKDGIWGTEGELKGALNYFLEHYDRNNDVLIITSRRLHNIRIWFVMQRLFLELGIKIKFEFAWVKMPFLTEIRTLEPFKILAELVKWGRKRFKK